MIAPFTPAGAAEFPNDNPALHRGVRWVVPVGGGPARAKPACQPAPVERRCDGPLELDLGRIILLHRVEDVPPPPDFIYTPFVSTRARPGLSAPSHGPILPRPCRVVDARQARLRVQRGGRVDVAPCVDIGAVERRPSRHRGGVVSCLATHLPAPETPIELQVASA